MKLRKKCHWKKNEFIPCDNPRREYERFQLIRELAIRQSGKFCPWCGGYTGKKTWSYYLIRILWTLGFDIYLDPSTKHDVHLK